MPRLIYIMKESGDPSLRLSALWAVKNTLRKTSTETKRDVMSYLGWLHLIEYVSILSLSRLGTFLPNLFLLTLAPSGYWVIRMRIYKSRHSM